jgi:hypothetical protein
MLNKLGIEGGRGGVEFQVRLKWQQFFVQKNLLKNSFTTSRSLLLYEIASTSAKLSPFIVSIFVQLGFSSDRVTTDKKSSSILFY